MVEKRVDDVPAFCGDSTVRPWTADFLLPSISFREPKRPSLERMWVSLDV